MGRLLLTRVCRLRRTARRLSRSLKANQADQRRQSDYEWPNSGWKRTAEESNNRIASLSKCQREPGHHDRRGGSLGDGDHEDHGENNRSDKGVSSGRVRGRSKHVRNGEQVAYERVYRSNDHQENGRAPYGDRITLIQHWSAALTQASGMLSRPFPGMRDPA